MKNKIIKILKELYKEKDKEKRFVIAYNFVILGKTGYKKFEKEFLEVWDSNEYNKEFKNLVKVLLTKDTFFLAT